MAIPLTARSSYITTEPPTRQRRRFQYSAPPAESKFGGTAAVLTNMLNSKSRSSALREHLRSEAGVTILEMVVAMLILTVGLLGLAAAIGYAVTVSNKGRNLTNSKLLVVSVLEQMETLRNTQELTFGQIANVGQVDNTGAPNPFAGFPTGFQPLSINPGPDGIFGTA